MAHRPHVVIVGGGFAGIQCAKALRGSGARITLIDRQNHHLFQPLLYQVATAALAAPSIAAPIREIFASRRDVQVLMGEVCGVDAAARAVTLASGRRIAGDYLVLAAGLRAVYFGHDDWRAHAPALKTVADAIEIRKRFVMAFENAELLDNEAEQSRELTFVVIGAGPTGVEMAGAFAELSRRTLRREYRHFDTSSARVVLIEGQDRVLPGYHEDSSRRAKADLEQLGVEVMLGTRVERIDGESVTLSSGEKIETRTVVWAAGVAGERLADELDAQTTRGEKVVVEDDLSLASTPAVFIAGDLAHVRDARRDEPVPGVAPAAIQMGRFVGRTIKREIAAERAGRPTPTRKRFAYRDKGALATIGRNRAVAELGGRRFGGRAAFVIWAAVHIYFLIGFRNRVMTMLQWFWHYALYDRGARIIPGPDRRCPQNDRMS